MGAITIALLGSCLALVVYGVPIFPSSQNSMKNNEEGPVISSAYAGELSANSGLYERVDGHSGLFYYYQAIQIKAHTAGTYTLMSESDLDLVGYFHKDNFDPSVPDEHLIVEDDDSGDSSLQFKIETFLDAGHTYILVVTTHGETEIGDFSVVATGPDSVTFEHITPTTSRPLLVPSVGPEVKSSYESELTSTSGLFQRVDGDSESFYHYEAIHITVKATGTYTIMSESDRDLVGYFYKDNFDPSVPTEHLITEDDDSGDSSLQFKIEAFLEAGYSYFIVVTTHGETETGHFSIEAAGPDSVTFEHIIPSTSRPILAPSIAPQIKTSHESELSSTSGLFQRVDGDSESFYHYEAIHITVSTTGTYIFMSNSNHDLVGYFYKDNFDPSVPTEHLITEDDDNGDVNLQFKIEAFLEAGQTYIIVVTTHSESETGHFSLEVTGPDSVILQRITPSTSRPILAPSTQPSIVSSYSTELSSDSLSFIRPDGDTESKYHYHALEITVSTSGLYEFTSESEMDTIGYLYDGSFEPADPTLNLISEDDDSGDNNLQFSIKNYLNIEHKYILVVTTHQESAVGSLSVTAKGPANVNLKSISS